MKAYAFHKIDDDLLININFKNNLKDMFWWEKSNVLNIHISFIDDILGGCPYECFNDSLYYGNDVMMKWNPKKWKVYSYSHFTHIAIRLERLSNYNELL